jgi:hypothetical protein
MAPKGQSQWFMKVSSKIFKDPFKVSLPFFFGEAVDIQLATPKVPFKEVCRVPAMPWMLYQKSEEKGQSQFSAFKHVQDFSQDL